MYNFNLTSLRSVVEPCGFKFVAGNEYVRSIFQHNPDYVFDLDVSGNYSATLEYLKKLEERRRDYENTFEKRLKNKIRTFVKEALKIT